MRNYIHLIRVPQWIKNAFVLVPLIFSKHLFDINYLLTALQGVGIFCLISSVVYISNDIVDREADALHPKKKFRPIASGVVSVQKAIFISIILVSVAIVFASGFSLKFQIVAALYLFMNIFYSFILKNIVLVDIFTIASGFMLRVVGGAYIINVETSSWLILTTMFVSLFLAIMKRRSELLLPQAGDYPGKTRKVLQEYTISFTDQMATIAASAVIICYALYTMAPRTLSTFGTDNLIYTTPFVVFGIFRYMYLVYKNEQGENSTEIMLSDIPMILTVFLYFSAIVTIVYRF